MVARGVHPGTIQDLQTGCEKTVVLMDHSCPQACLEKDFLMLQGAISFGSAFEGWIAREEKEVVHHVLVPLTPPRGHTFHLEDDADGGRPSRNFVSVWS